MPCMQGKQYPDTDKAELQKMREQSVADLQGKKEKSLQGTQSHHRKISEKSKPADWLMAEGSAGTYL